MRNSPDNAEKIVTGNIANNLKQTMTNDSFEVKSGSELMQGTVKWFNDAKGFGFIEHVSGRDVFVHYSVIETEGFKTLKDGEIVQYSLAEGDKGLHAARVIRDPAVVKSAMKAKQAQDGEEMPELEVDRISEHRIASGQSDSGVSASSDSGAEQSPAEHKNE